MGEQPNRQVRSHPTLEHERRLREELDRLRLENQRLYVERQELAERPVRILRLLAKRVRHALLVRSRPRATEPQQRDSGVRSDWERFLPYRVQVPGRLPSGRLLVLHVLANVHTGGSTQLVVDLVERLGDQYEQIVVTRDRPPKPAYLGLRIVDDEIGSAADALALLRRIQPALVHVHFLGHHNDNYSERDWQWYARLFRAIEQHGCEVIENVNIPIVPYFSSSVRAYVFVSDYVRDLYGRAGDRNITIYPGSDLEFFSRRESPEPPDDTIGMVYRLEGDKLDERAIDVFAEVVRRRPQTRALIVGGGRFSEAYRNEVAMAGLDGAFTFTGYVPYEQLPALYEGLSVFVAPVHTESFGQVAPFAMAMGIPVVGYDVGALPEIVGDPELLAPPGDAAALADIVIRLLDDRHLRLEIGRESRRRAESHFGVRTMIERYAAIYAEGAQAWGRRRAGRTGLAP